MSDNFVTLILKTVIDVSQLLGFEYFASLVLEHYSSNSRLYGQTLNKVFYLQNGNFHHFRYRLSFISFNSTFI